MMVPLFILAAIIDNSANEVRDTSRTSFSFSREV